MGYVPPRPPDLNRYTATLYTLASIYDVGNQDGPSRSALPRSYSDYLARLYGHAATDWFMVLNYAMLAAMVALILTILAFVTHLA